MNQAVIHVDVLYFEHCHKSLFPPLLFAEISLRSTSGFAQDFLLRCPSASRRPKFSTHRYSQMPETSFMSCSMSMTVTPNLSRIDLDVLHQLLRLVRVHAGGRLVEQQQRRVRCQRADDLQTALRAVRNRPCCL